VTCASTLTKSFASRRVGPPVHHREGISAKELIDVFDQAYGVDDTRLLQSSADKCRVEVHVEAPTVSLVFAELGGQVKSLFQTNGDAGPLLTAEVPGDVEARTAVQAVGRCIQISD